jgi:hypothetical protein
VSCSLRLRVARRTVGSASGSRLSSRSGGGGGRTSTCSLIVINHKYSDIKKDKNRKKKHTRLETIYVSSPVVDVGAMVVCYGGCCCCWVLRSHRRSLACGDVASKVVCVTNCVMFVSVVGVVISNSAFFGGTCI